MKAKKLLITGLLALATAGAAQAQTIVHITGSTAFRGAVHQAILDMLQPGATYAYTGTSFTGASQAIFSGTAKTNSISVIIKTSWSGSLAGIQTVSQAVPALVSTFLTNTTPMSTGGTASAASNFDPPTQPEVCLNDGYQFDSQFPTPALTETPVGAVDFKFVKNAAGVSNAPALTNMTPLLAQALWEHGSLPYSMWTGNTNDVNTIVYATGRDVDSGTRKTAFLETALQTYTAFPLTIASIEQYAPSNSSGIVNKSNPGAITSYGLWAPETIDNIFLDVGQGGYNSGGDLAVALSQSAPIIMVGYLGLSDDATLTNNIGPSADLAYNGTYFSHAAVQNGQYTYWTYEFLGYLPSYISTIANAQPVADLLARTIQSESTLLSYGDYLSTMNVSRQIEGGIVTP